MMQTRVYRPHFGGTGFVLNGAEAGRNAVPGDAVVLRDFSAYTVKGWEARSYELANGETGAMLMAFGVHREDPEDAIPDEICIEPGLEGTYSIWVGVPRVELKPRIFAQGPDLALDDGGWTMVTPFTGTRHGNVMGPTGCEHFVFWRNAELKPGRSRIRIRVPFGQCGLWPYGIVNCALSSIRLVKIDPKVAYESAGAAARGKTVDFVIDGFSHYLNARPGEEFDSRFAEMYRDRGVTRITWQSPATGVVAWPSAITDIPGDGLSADRWNELRVCDRRIHDYLAWANATGNEGIRTLGEACRHTGIEFHLSLRMNLYWRMNERDHTFAEFINGRWWREHPEALMPDGCFLDYAKPEARKFVSDIVAEAAQKYRFDGFNLDLTRWPPVFRSPGLLPMFLRELREVLPPDRKLGFIAVEGYHANRTLEQQYIDIEAALATGCVDFFGVQAFRQRPYARLARKYGVGYTAVLEQEAVNHPGGYCEDPMWQDPVLRDSDPVPGEEFWDAPRVNGTLSPQEYDVAAARAYAAGAGGVSITNNDFACLLGALSDTRGIKKRLADGSAFGQIQGHMFIKI